MKNLVPTALIVLFYYSEFHAAFQPKVCLSWFYQDPAKTTKYPNSDPPVSSPDGSSGKYKKNHKSANGHHFASHHSHIKKAKKSSGTNAIEKKKESATR